MALKTRTATTRTTTTISTKETKAGDGNKPAKASPTATKNNTASTTSPRKRTAPTARKPEPPKTTGKKPEPPKTTGKKPEPPKTTRKKMEPPKTAGKKPETPKTTGKKLEPPKTTGKKPEPPKTTGKKLEPPKTAGKKPEPESRTTPPVVVPPKVLEMVARAEDQQREEKGGTQRGTQEKAQSRPTRTRKATGNVEPKGGAVAEAPKPAVPAGQPADSPRPQPSYFREEQWTAAEQVTREEMRKLSHTARHDLWKSLNENTPSNVFATILKPSELPKDVAMRLAEAVARGIVPVKKEVREGQVFYCPYCVDWMKFRTHSYTGSEKCIGCGISTMDYYTRGDNNLWKVV